jgi:hypothetical protein
MRFVLAAALVAMFALPASAQSFYIVQDSASKKCTIVTEKPTVTSSVVIGNKTYTTKSEAEGALKTTTVCTQ